MRVPAWQLGSILSGSEAGSRPDEIEIEDQRRKPIRYDGRAQKPTGPQHSLPIKNFGLVSAYAQKGCNIPEQGCLAFEFIPPDATAIATLHIKWDPPAVVQFVVTVWIDPIKEK